MNKDTLQNIVSALFFVILSGLGWYANKVDQKVDTNTKIIDAHVEDIIHLKGSSEKIWIFYDEDKKLQLVFRVDNENRMTCVEKDVEHLKESK